VSDNGRIRGGDDERTGCETEEDWNFHGSFLMQ
jgi:hypothetical protein